MSRSISSSRLGFEEVRVYGVPKMKPHCQLDIKRIAQMPACPSTSYLFLFSRCKTVAYLFKLKCCKGNCRIAEPSVINLRGKI